MRLDEGFLKRVLPEAVVLHGTLDSDVTFSVDSRSIEATQLFVPLQGSRTDGHSFLEKALQTGAGALISRDKKFLLDQLSPELVQKKCIIVVADPFQALQTLAAAWRAQFSYPIVAITGSIGKTSTKEFIATILAKANKRCMVSHGNQNTLIGVALNMVRLHADHEVALFEVGISERGEMAQLAQLLHPTTAVITGVGHSHMEGLGTMSNIAVEKRDVFKYFGEASIGIINGDQPVLSNVGYNHPVIRFGTKTTNQIQARKIKIDDNHLSFVLKLYKEKYPLEFNQNHRGVITNSLAASAVAHFLGVDGPTIVQGLQEVPTRSQRFESCSLKGYRGTLIDDCYNASPESMKAALLALQELKTTGKKIAVLGDMLELGETGPFWHRQVGRFLRRTPSLSHLILVGDQVKWIEKTVPVGIKVEKVAGWQDAIERLKYSLENDAVVLVKGSRGMQLQNVVAAFTDKQSTAS
jgi:UDP-N-acetylmuramoyl-tripeptide--D-alanyl-D-alanine ligase